MIYNDLLSLITFADNLIAHIQKQQVDKKSDFIDIVFLIYIEQIFDLKARGLYSDQEGFNLDENERMETKRKITESMDKIRAIIPDLINAYGREQFLARRAEMARLHSEDWVKDWLNR